jgi:hypothetical protein
MSGGIDPGKGACISSIEYFAISVDIHTNGRGRIMKGLCGIKLQYFENPS